jgi:glycosyltransferase involved in cell wall biosynthesis
MNGNESVSVVIPAYNAERFIVDAIKSCFNQTYRPIEILVINDGSTDSTVDVVNGLSDIIPDDKVELRLIDIGENRGAANALNVGFSSAKGAYICWLSADDMFVDKKKVEKQVAQMNKTEALWSYYRDFYTGTSLSKSRLVKSSHLPRLRILDPLFIRNPDLRLISLFFKNPINGSSIMIRKDSIEAYGQFDPITTNVDGDGDLWMRYSALKLKLSALKGATVFYRENPAQTSKKKTVMIYGCELTRMRMLITLQKRGNLSKLIKKFTLYFPIIVKAKKHFERPFTSEFLFNYILDHEREFNRVFRKYIRKSLNDVKKHANYLMLDKDKFSKDLKLFMESHAFKKFEETFFKNDGLQWKK